MHEFVLDMYIRPFKTLCAETIVISLLISYTPLIAAVEEIIVTCLCRAKFRQRCNHVLLHRL